MMRNQRGFALIGSLVALAVLATAGSAFLVGLATLSRSTAITREQATAESLVRAEIEYVKDYPYQQSAVTYPVNPELSIPPGWQVAQPTVEPVHSGDDGLQEVAVSAQRGGRTVLSIVIYKTNR